MGILSCVRNNPISSLSWGLSQASVLLSAQAELKWRTGLGTEPSHVHRHILKTRYGHTATPCRSVESHMYTAKLLSLTSPGLSHEARVMGPRRREGQGASALRECQSDGGDKNLSSCSFQSYVTEMP